MLLLLCLLLKDWGSFQTTEVELKIVCAEVVFVNKLSLAHSLAEDDHITVRVQRGSRSHKRYPFASRRVALNHNKREDTSSDCISAQVRLWRWRE